MAAKKNAVRKPATVKVYKSFGQLAKASGEGAVRGLRIDFSTEDRDVVVSDASGNVRLHLPLTTALDQIAVRCGIRFAHITHNGIEVP